MKKLFLVYAIFCFIAIQLHANVSIPRINVEPSIDWGVIKLADLTIPVCDSTIVYNRGTDTLTVTGYKGVDDITNYDLTTVSNPAASLSPFTIYNMDGSPLIFPFKVAPGESLAVRVCLQTTLSKNFVKYLVFISDAYRGDSYLNDDWSQLTANTEQINISADYINFGERRVNSRNKGTITITNSGQSPVKVLYIKNAKNRKYSMIHYTDGTITLDNNFTITTDMKTILVDSQLVQKSYFASSAYAALGHPITFDVEYTPTTEDCLADSLVFTFVKVDLANPGKITPATNKVATTVLAYVKGCSYLPKATISPAQAYSAPLRKDSTSSEAINVTIADTSSSRDLSVQSIDLTYDNLTYKSINFKTAPTIPTTIQKGSPLVHEVTFFGSDNGDATLSNYNRNLTVTVTADTKDGSSLPLYRVTNNTNGAGDWMTAPNNSDTMTTISTTITGTVYDYTRVIMVDTAVAFNQTSTSACDPIIGTFKVYNTSRWIGDRAGAGSTDIVISNMRQYGDSSLFAITNFNPASPNTLLMGTEKTYLVTFTPIPKSSGSYSSPIKIVNNAWTGVDSLACKMNSTVMSANLALNMDANSATLVSELKGKKKGDIIPVALVIKDNSSIAQGSGLRKISLNLKYDLRLLKYSGNISFGNIDASWSWSATGSRIPDSLIVLNISGVGSSEIYNSGQIAVINFEILADSDNSEVELSMDSASIDFYDRTNCIVYTAEGGKIDLSTNGVEENSKYLSAIYPNPAQDYLYINSEEYFTSDYKIYSIAGALILEGTASDKIDVSNLEKGVYILKTNKQTFRFVKI